jgi:hypothetical protein
VFWVFVYVFFGMAPLLQLAAGEFPWRGEYAVGQVAFGYGIVVLGLATYDLGRLWAAMWPPDGGDTRIRWRVTRVRILALAVVGAVLSLLIIRSLGLGAFAVPRSVFLQLISGGATDAVFAMKVSLLRVPPYVVTLAVWMLLRERGLGGSGLRRVGWLAVLCVAGALTSVTSNPIIAPRFWFGTVVLSFLVAGWRWSRTASAALWTWGLVLGLTVVFPFMDVFRNTLDPSAGRGESSVVETARRNLTEKGDYASFQQVLNTRRAIDEARFAYGEQLLGTVLFWYPRAWWPSKPLHTGQRVARSQSYRYTNLEAPFWSEGYAAGGLLGVAAFFFLYGALTGALTGLHRRAEASTRSGAVARLLVAVLAPYQLFLLRGSLSVAVGFVLPVILTIGLIGRRGETTGRLSPASAGHADSDRS